MGVFFGPLAVLEWVNSRLLAVCRAVAIILLGLMVCIILAQVVSRYVFDSPLNWTEEAARFGMLWMVGLVAPMAYRQGGFVAIDLLERSIPPRAAAVLGLLILGLSLAVLAAMAYYGWNNHIDTLSGRGRSSALKIPLSLFGGEDIRFRNQWMFFSLFWGVCVMLSVTIELILREKIVLFGHGDRLKRLDDGEELAGSS